MGIEEVYRQRTSADVQTAECLDCAQCVGACPSNGALGIEFLTFNLFSSSQNYVAGVRKK
jgi:ferredoxin